MSGYNPSHDGGGGGTSGEREFRYYSFPNPATNGLESTSGTSPDTPTSKVLSVEALQFHRPETNPIQGGSVLFLLPSTSGDAADSVVWLTDDPNCVSGKIFDTNSMGFPTVTVTLPKGTLVKTVIDALQGEEPSAQQTYPWTTNYRGASTIDNGPRGGQVQPRACQLWTDVRKPREVADWDESLDDSAALVQFSYVVEPSSHARKGVMIQAVKP